MDLSVKVFKNQKKQIMEAVDESRKGSIDEPIVEVVDIINNHEDYVTTSSCSGRVILFCEDDPKNGRRKQNCKWIYTSHNIIEPDDFIRHCDPSLGDLVLKFEPFILHVQCRTLDSAKCLQKCALESGLRNSGIVIGQHGKMTLAVRCTQCLEVPVTSEGKILVSEEYLRFLAKKANEKMKENACRIYKFKVTVEKLINM